jgi:hypothetical protein
MVLLSDEAQVEARFSPFGDSANLDARYVRDLGRMYHRLENCIGHTRWKLLGDVGHVQDRCTVCAKHTIGLEIIFDAPDGIPR